MSIFGFADSIKLTLTATIFSLSINIICSSSSKETPNFILLQCILKHSQKLTVQWKSPHRELTTPDENLFVSVETFAEKASESFLVLYIRKNTGKSDVFVCSSSSEFWAFDGAEVARQLSDTEVEQQYSDWIHLNLGAQSPDQQQQHFSRPLSWSERATIALNLLTGAPWLLVVITSLTLLLHCLFLFAIFRVSERFLQAAANFSRIAFIMTEGDKVRTLAKLKRQLGNDAL